MLEDRRTEDTSSHWMALREREHIGIHRKITRLQHLENSLWESL
jgi:hypothetical protein